LWILLKQIYTWPTFPLSRCHLVWLGHPPKSDDASSPFLSILLPMSLCTFMRVWMYSLGRPFHPFLILGSS
jgi:hypothetical protein